MPRAKDDKAGKERAPAEHDEAGFAALEAKVEEVQAEAAIEAELAAEDAALAAAVPTTRPHSALVLAPRAATPTPPQGVRQAAPARAAPAPPVGWPVGWNAAGATVGEAFVAAAQLQADTFGRLARARSLPDLVDAQVHYGRGLVDLYVANVTRLLRQFATPLPGGGAAAFAARLDRPGAAR